MAKPNKPLIMMGGEVKTPPFSQTARLQTGVYLRKIQSGIMLTLPISRPMPSIASGVHELRIRDADHFWRIVYYIGTRHIVILSVFAKKTQATPTEIIQQCRRVLREYEDQERDL